MTSSLRLSTQQTLVQFQLLFDRFDYGAWVADHTGKICSLGSPLLKLLGLTEADVTTFDWANYLSEHERARFSAAWAACIEHQPVRWERLMLVKGADGNWHDVLSRGAPIMGDNGQIAGWAGVLFDARRLRGELHEPKVYSSVVHELRNTLMPMLTSTQMLRAKSSRLQNDTMNWSIGIIEQKIRHLTHLAKISQDLFNVMTGNLVMDRRALDLKTVASKAIETSVESTNDTPTSFKHSPPTDSIWVEGDSERLRQATVGLMACICHSREANEPIELSVYRSDASAYLLVRGTELSEPDQNFWEMVTAETWSRELAVMLGKYLVELHGGVLRALPSSNGKRPAFMLILPLLDAKTTAFDT